MIKTMLLRLIIILLKFVYPYKLRSVIASRLNNKLIFNQPRETRDLLFGPKTKMNLITSDYGHRQIIITGFYELELSILISSLARKSSGILIDVGANFGYFSLLWCKINANNKAYAFEPSPKNHLELKKNIELNNLNDKIKVEMMAISKENGIMNFIENNASGQTGWGGLTIDNNINTFSVETISLDAYCLKNNIDRISVLKIDTEGADTWVLYGAKKMLRLKKIRHIFFEMNYGRLQNLSIDRKEAFIFLTELGYNLTEIAPDEYHATI